MDVSDDLSAAGPASDLILIDWPRKPGEMKKDATEAAVEVSVSQADNITAQPPESKPGPEFTVEMWPIDRPKPYPANARKITYEAISAVARSIRQFGFRVPIVVDENEVIVMGHVRQRAARRLKMTHVPVHVARGLDPEKVRLLRIADNRVHEETSWDKDILAQELNALQMDNVELNLTDTGFSDLELTKMIDPENPDLVGKEAQIEEQWLIVIECTSEADQVDKLRTLMDQGITCRAMNS